MLWIDYQHEERRTPERGTIQALLEGNEEIRFKAAN